MVRRKDDTLRDLYGVLFISEAFSYVGGEKAGEEQIPGIFVIITGC